MKAQATTTQERKPKLLTPLLALLMLTGLLSLSGCTAEELYPSFGAPWMPVMGPAATANPMAPATGTTM